MDAQEYLKLWLTETFVKHPSAIGSYRNLNEIFWAEALPLAERVEKFEE